MQEEYENYLKIPKKAGLIIYGASNSSISFKWAFDFLDQFNSNIITIPTSGSLAEFGVAEFGLGEFGGGSAYSNSKTSMTRNGRIIKFGIQATVNGLELAVQQISLQAKLGKMVI
jgi:hypothetical protein